MLTPEQIEDQLQRQDIQPYLNKIYDADLPDSLVDQFRVAMMYLPVTAHKYSMDDVETMSIRRGSEVTVREVGLMLNAIFAVPFANMYESIEEGIEKTRVFEKIRAEYNKETERFQNKINKKRQTLLSLSGVGNSIPINGLKKL